MSKQSFDHKMRKQYCQALPLLNKVIEHVETTLSDLPEHDFQLETNIKPYKRAMEKAEENQLKDLTQLSDLARGRLYFSDNFVHQEVIDLLKEIFKDKIKNIEAKKTKDFGLDYSGIVHCDMNIDGINFELQILPSEFKPYKDMLHNIYEELRGENEAPEDRKKHLQQLHNKIYNFVNKKFTKNRSSDD